MTIGDTIPVGVRLYVGFTELPVQGTDPVRLTSASVVGLPSGLKVDRVAAVSEAETARNGAGGHVIGAITEDMLSQGYPNLRLHPLSDAVLHAGGALDWYVVVVVEATRPGDYRTSGLRLTYAAGGSTGTVEYAYRIHIATKLASSSPTATASA